MTLSSRSIWQRSTVEALMDDAGAREAHDDDDSGTDSALMGVMIVMDALLLGWLTFIVGFVIAWARFHGHVRALHDIDEDAYIHGQVGDVGEPDPHLAYPQGRSHGRSRSRWHSSPAV